MRHIVTFAFLVAALAAYSLAPGVPAPWLAGALFAAAILCELIFWLRLFQREKPLLPHSMESAQLRNRERHASFKGTARGRSAWLGRPH